MASRVDTSGDEHFRFIKDLKAVKTLFDGTFRIHDRNATVIAHLGNEFVPLFSTRTQILGIDECILLALQKDGDLPGLICFVGTEGRSEQGFLNMAIMILWFCRQESSQCVLALERSPWAIATGDTPTPRFIRDFTNIVPYLGCSSIAIFPARDEAARSKSRLVSYVASSQADFKFIEFPSFHAYHTWLREAAQDLRAHDMSRLCLFSSKEEGVANFRLRFAELEKKFPGDAAYVARRLGNSNLRRRPSEGSIPEPAAPTHLFPLVDNDNNFPAAEDWSFDSNECPKTIPLKDETVHGDMAVVTGTPCASPVTNVASPRARVKKNILPTIDEE